MLKSSILTYSWKVKLYKLFKRNLKNLNARNYNLLIAKPISKERKTMLIDLNRNHKLVKLVPELWILCESKEGTEKM